MATLFLFEKQSYICFWIEVDCRKETVTKTDLWEYIYRRRVYDLRRCLEKVHESDL